MIQKTRWIEYASVVNGFDNQLTTYSFSARFCDIREALLPFSAFHLTFESPGGSFQAVVKDESQI